MSSKLNSDIEFLPLQQAKYTPQVQEPNPTTPEEQLEDPFEYSKKSMQNFHRKSALEQPQFLKDDLSINKSFILQNIGQSFSYRGSISDIKNFTDNLTLNSAELQKSSTNFNFFSSNKKELSQIINNIFISNKCKLMIY